MTEHEMLARAEAWVAEVTTAYNDGGYAAGDGPTAPLDEMEWLLAEVNRLRDELAILLPVARLYVDAFGDDETMTLPERMRLQVVEDVLEDPDGWTPGV